MKSIYFLFATIMMIAITSCTNDDKDTPKEDNSQALALLEKAKNIYWWVDESIVVDNNGVEMTVNEAYQQHYIPIGAMGITALHLDNNTLRLYFFEGNLLYEDFEYTIDHNANLQYLLSKDGNIRILSVDDNELILELDRGHCLIDKDADDSNGIVYQENAYYKVKYVPANDMQLQWLNAAEPF